ncbi:hypothetical protein [Nannocystis punicea]|uniref:VOC domain-containing protein n=1 Tax=Nannocystis punicea TaxID=2995304 RepID=A0ABY7GS48_9BACT|nr:hypothetical protein [Nannocystis poenicansa]WAS89753.1 hypothetical protein O0S08_26470 [Nannocystis poenicansa]
MTGFSLKELIVDGHLGGARVGMDRAAVRGHLGPPDEWGIGAVAVDCAAIWRYGNFEIHFAEDDLCWMIFNDHVQDGLDAGGRGLDPWIFTDRFDHDTTATKLRALGLEVGVLVEWEMRVLQVGGAKLFFDEEGWAVIEVQARSPAR